MNTTHSHHILVIDTCVWLDIAKGGSTDAVITALEEMIASSTIRVFCPMLVVEEFERNLDRIVEASRQRLSHEFRRVKKVVSEVSADEQKESLLEALEEVHHKLPIFQDKIFESVNRVETLIEQADELPISDLTKLSAANRAIDKRAPFHKNKNSMADALIIEAYFVVLNSEPSSTVHFITFNTKDFSSSSDNRRPHEDYDEFGKFDNARFSTNIVETLKEIEPVIFEDAIFEHDWTMETRGLYEILGSIDEFVDKVWYNRHCLREEAIRSGRIKLLPEAEYKGYDPNVIRSDIWEGALKAAESTRERFPDELGPFSDFEWGMLNGKLSALRWVLGDEWDMLDT